MPWLLMATESTQTASMGSLHRRVEMTPHRPMAAKNSPNITKMMFIVRPPINNG